MTATVSVCIPAWNAARFIEGCVRSALEVEGLVDVVVLDDGSTDGTGAIVAAIAADDPRVRLVTNAERLGRAQNIQRALLAGEGELVLLLPADDEVVAAGLERLRKELDVGDSAFAFGAAEVIDEDGKRLRDHRPFDDAWTSTPAAAVRALLPHDPVLTTTALIRRARLLEVGGLRLDIAPSHRDWDLFLRLAAVAGATYVPDVVARDRSHPGNFTDQIRGTDFTSQCELLVLQAFHRWTVDHAPGCTGEAVDGLRRWARSQFATGVLGRAGLRTTTPEAVVGLAMAADPRFRREPRYWLALAALHLPAAVMRLLRPVLRRLDRASAWV